MTPTRVLSPFLRKAVLALCVFALARAAGAADSAGAMPASDTAFVSSGIPEIDAMRRDFAKTPTNATNALARQALMFSWVRLLVHRGIDMRDFHVACADFSRWGPIPPERYGAMEEAWQVLERIQAHPRFIPEVRGKPADSPSTVTDWPVFQGNPQQSGFSPDRGPQTGEIAWAFPIGLSWYAAPAVENGRVYIASPGVTTLLYCLDEKTGAVQWKTRQNGLQIYATPRASSTPVLTKNDVILRATSGSWEVDERVRDVFYIDKQTGRVVKRTDANRVDYRRGIAPIDGNDNFIVYPWSRLDLRGSPSVVQMQDTVVVRKSNGDPWWWLRVGDMFGAPTIAGNLVYAPTEAGTLYALHLMGPQRIAWVFDAHAPLRSTPAVDGDTVYVCAQNGILYALEQATGKVRWSLTLTQGNPRAFLLFSRPTISGHRLYVGSATRELYCVDTTSGRLVWTAPTTDWIRSRPLVLDGTVYAAGLDGKVTAYNPEGRQLWSAAAGTHPIFADLAGTKNGILVSSSGLYLYSLSPSDGREQWRHSLLECVYEHGKRILADVVAGGGDYQSPPTTSHGKVFVGGPDRFVHAVDQATGREAWRFETSGQVSGAPTIQDGRVFFGQQGGNNEMYCVSEADGSPIWKSRVGWVWTTATPDGDRLFTGTVDGNILAVATADGHVLWKRPTNGGIYPSPAVHNGRVFTGSWDGYYYALDRNTGQIDWCYATEGHDYAFGGGPDSEAAILWKGKLIARVLPQTLIALDENTGTPAWRFEDHSRARPKHGMNATPSGSGNHLFISTSIDHDGVPCGARLFCLDDKTGKVVWQYDGAGGWTGSSCTPTTVLCGSSTDVFMNCVAIQPNPDGTPHVVWRTRVGSIFHESIPAISGDRAYVLCSDGHLYAFR